MTFLVPVSFMYLCFFIGVFLYLGSKKQHKIYGWLHKLYVVLFYLTLFTYIVWSLMRNTY